MDHLPIPSQPQRIIKVPFLGQYYDGNDFDSYLNDQGWTDEIWVDALTSFSAAAFLGKSVFDGLRLLDRLQSSRDVEDSMSARIILHKGKMSLMRALALVAVLAAAFDPLSSWSGPQGSTFLQRISDPAYLQRLRTLPFERVLELLKLSVGLVLTSKMWLHIETELISWAVFLPEDPTYPTRREMQQMITNLGLFDSAQKHGWPHYVLDVHSVNARTTRSALAFLQSWVFFGLLKQMFNAAGLHLRQDAFVDEKTHCLTTVTLRDELKTLAARERQLDTSTRTEHYRHFDQMTLLGYALTTSAANLISDRLPPSAITYSIHMLMNALRWGSQVTYGIRSPSIGSKQLDFITMSCLTEGWCPKQFFAFQNTHTVFLMYYTYLLRKRPSDVTAHMSCNELSCNASGHLEQGKYRIRHVDQIEGPGSCETCRSVANVQSTIKFPWSVLQPLGQLIWYPNGAKISQIILGGGVPLISALLPSRDTESPYDMQPTIIEHQTDMVYVAISHVWAQGRGNPAQNSLPLCQLYEIIGYLNRLELKRSDMDARPQVVNFWIDTICVPLAPVETRNFAKIHMADVYRNATAVLVLDDSLMVERYPDEIVDALILVAMSGWSQRLWTYQEAALACEVVIVFANRLVSVANMAYEWQREYLGDSSKSHASRSTTERLLGKFGGDPLSSVAPQAVRFGATPHDLLPWWGVRDMVDRDVRMRNHTRMDSNDYVLPGVLGISFNYMWSGVQGRDTKQPEDEFICIGHILQLDVDEILQASESEKMRTILQLQQKLPMTILFTHTERMIEPGFRWAPRSFLSHTSAKGILALNGQRKEATVTEYGLMAKLSSLKFPANAQRMIMADMGFKIAVDLGLSPGPIRRSGGRSKWSFVVYGLKEEGSLDSLSGLDMDKMVLLLERPLEDVVGIGQYAALVMIIDRSFEVTKARYIAPVQLVAEGSTNVGLTMLSNTTQEAYIRFGLYFEHLTYHENPTQWLIT